jgi:hypothetical protein
MVGQPKTESIDSPFVAFVDPILNRTLAVVSLLNKLIVLVAPNINQILAILMREFRHSSTFKVKGFSFWSASQPALELPNPTMSLSDLQHA